MFQQPCRESGNGVTQVGRADGQAPSFAVPLTGVQQEAPDARVNYANADTQLPTISIPLGKKMSIMWRLFCFRRRTP